MAEGTPPTIDPSFQPLIDAFAGDMRVSLGKMLVAPGLKVDGKFFAFAAKGGLAVKLPRERVQALIAAGAGLPFDRGQGTPNSRPMKEWVAIPPGAADWIALAREACGFVARAG